ncbi:MAG TPA: D-2-hydroxyacid dehydrogenase [Pelagibacteraceae bacterium]|nr:D-2-hydroxyacid dehydrogenase [Pelagibacterales bacterium]HIN07216.1 D-2-hydroxyacid dehydrogenase [Pelagibacteraceae bacterium]
MKNNKKIKIHVKNNHWAAGSFPTDAEGEKVFTIKNSHFEKAFEKFPEIKEKVEIFIDWDEDNFNSSMSNSDILITWNFPTSNLKKVSPNLKWIHCVSAGVEHLLPLNWMFEGLILTNNSGVHSKKAGEYGLMSILMLHNHIPKIISNQKNKKFESLFSTPIAGKTIVVVGTGNLGGAMIRLLAPLGPKIIGVNRKGEAVDGCSKVITVDKIDSILPEADILYLAMPETPGTKNLISRKRLDLLKPSCGIVNIGRQSAMDYDVLCEKLRTNKLAGAILDVFVPEPIELNSKLWQIPNLIITPHVSADDGESYVRLTLELFTKNLKLFISNKPLINQINKNFGY